MPQSETITPIPTHEELKATFFKLMFAADYILTEWQKGDPSLPEYIRRHSSAPVGMCHRTLRQNLESVLREFPDREFAPDLKAVMEILGSEEEMSKFTPKEKMVFIREAAIHATHVVYHLHVRAFRAMRVCGQFERGEMLKAAVEMELADYERHLDALMPRRA